jgi:hypothetical protein
MGLIPVSEYFAIIEGKVFFHIRPCTLAVFTPELAEI